MDVSEFAPRQLSGNRIRHESILPQVAVMLISAVLVFAIAVMLVQIHRMNTVMTDLNTQVQVLQTELQEREIEIEALTAGASGQN